MERKELTIEDLKNFANDLIDMHNQHYPADRIQPIDPAAQIGLFDIGAVVGRVGGRLGISMGQPYSTEDLSTKMGEIRREIENRGWK